MYKLHTILFLFYKVVFKRISMILKLTRCYWKFPQDTTVVGIHAYIFPDVSIICEIQSRELLVHIMVGD